MKIRTGFVSNSSTASFILRRDALTSTLLDRLKGLSDDWYIKHEDSYTYGGTIMDNDGIVGIFKEHGLKEYMDFYVPDHYEPIPVTQGNLEEFFAPEINANRDKDFDKESFCEEHALKMFEMIFFS